MAQGVLDNWKIFVNESCDSKTVQEKMVGAIDKATSIGVNVTAVVSDFGSDLTRSMNILPHKSWLIHRGKKLSLFLINHTLSKQ